MGVIVIAEAGVNHNGDLDLAKAMISAAAEAGADYVKFQTFEAHKVASSDAEMAAYQRGNAGNFSNSQSEMLSRLEINRNDHHVLKTCAADCGIQFLSTGFDLDSLDFLNALGLSFFKIPSGEVTNLPYLRQVASYKLPVIMSTGMAALAEVEAAINVLLECGVSHHDLTLLHCNTAYPTAMVDVNLRAMVTMAQQFDVKYGYSDHTLGTEVAVAAVALGASVIEKHFTLDRSFEGPDHNASLEVDELRYMVKAIRNIEKALGHGIKKPTDSELNNVIAARKSIVASRFIKKGEIFTEENLTVKRPGKGLSPMLWDQILGEIASRDYRADEMIEK